MGQEAVNGENWRRLFEAAISFKRLACWNWMENEDYFAITDPETGERGYCVVFGAGGIEYGLSVYLGEEGAAYLQEITGLDMLGDDTERMHNVKAITVIFEDRAELDKSDLHLIRELGYKFRGSREWPKFRGYEPGLVPWGLNEQQVRFLTAALEQAYLVAERFRENNELYFDHDEQDDGFGEKRLHRVPTVTAGGIVWEDKWLPWVEKLSLSEPYTYPDEVGLQQLKKALKSSKDIWESDYEYAPFVVGERGEREIYPRLCLWVHQGSGMIMNVEIVEYSDCRADFVKQMIFLLKEGGRKPARIDVGSQKAFMALQNTADKLGIPISFNPMLDELLEAKEAITNSF